MKIALACDHGALEYKNLLKDLLSEEGHEITDFGTYTKDSCDYPDYIEKAAHAVADHVCDRGIVLCSTGTGASIAANKVKGIRCALVSDCVTARLTREHNDSNILALGQLVTGEAVMKEIVHIWLSTEFSGLEKHARRIEKIAKMEE